MLLERGQGPESVSEKSEFPNDIPQVNRFVHVCSRHRVQHQQIGDSVTRTKVLLEMAAASTSLTIAQQLEELDIQTNLLEAKSLQGEAVALGTV